MQSDEYKLWFDRAEDNLKWSEDSFEDGFYPLVCFLTQQAVELAIKGYFYFKDIVPPKTHDIPELLKKGEKIDLKIEDNMIPKASTLSKYYLESRYPDMLEENLNDKDIAKEALEFAKEIVDEVKKQIPT